MLLALDTETHLIDRAKLAPRPVCLSWADPLPQLGLIRDLYERLQDWLLGHWILTGVYTAYDMAVLGEYWPDLLPLIFAKYERGEIHDCSIREKMLRIAAQGRCEPAYSLASLAEIYELPPVDKDGPWRMDYARLDEVPVESWPAGAREYPLKDASVPLQVHQCQDALDKKWTARAGSPVLHLSGQEAYKAFVLHLISCWGIHTDPERTKAFKARLEKFLERAKVDLVKAGLVRPDGTRDTKLTKARMERVCSELDLPLALTDKGGVCLDKEACEATHDTTLQQYSAYSQHMTLRARAEDLMQGFVLPLQTRFDSLLETSRTSSSKPKPPLVGIQAQNNSRDGLSCEVCAPCLEGTPRKCKNKLGPRECLKPRPGHRFLVCDLPTAELRSLAQTCIDKGWPSRMADQINAGLDLHSWFACKILGISYEEGMARLLAGDEEFKEARQQAKPCNFGFPGGMGITNFRAFAWRTYKVRLSEERAKQLKGIWLAAFPEMKLYFGWISGMFPNDRQYTLIRFLRSQRWRGRVMYCGAANGFFQELTANGAAAGLCLVSRECYTDRQSPLFDSRIVMFTHDEQVLETPIELCELAGPRLAQLMTDGFNKFHPDVPITKMKADVVDVYTKG